MIKRTRKRGIEKAKFMDHTSYEWSQWWKKNEYTTKKSSRISCWAKAFSWCQKGLKRVA